MPSRGLQWNVLADSKLRVRPYRSGLSSMGPKFAKSDYLLYPPTPKLRTEEITVEFARVISNFDLATHDMDHQLRITAVNEFAGRRYPDGYYYSPDVCVALYRGNPSDRDAPSWMRIPLFSNDYQIHLRVKILKALLLASDKEENSSQKMQIQRFVSVSAVQIGHLLPHDFPPLLTPPRRPDASNPSVHLYRVKSQPEGVLEDGDDATRGARRRLFEDRLSRTGTGSTAAARVTTTPQIFDDESEANQFWLDAEDMSDEALGLKHENENEIGLMA